MTVQHDGDEQVPSPSIDSALIMEFPLTPDRALSQAEEQKKCLLVICAQSLRPIAEQEITSALGQEMGFHTVEIVWLDFTDLETNWIMAHPEQAVQRLIDPQESFHRALARQGEAEFAFYGLTRIPLAFLIGHFVPSHRPVHLFDIHPHPTPGLDTWIWPGPRESFPPLEVFGLPKRKNVLKRSAAVRISISYTVTPVQTHAIGLHTALGIDIAVPHPVRGIVRSEEQVREYGRVFHQMLDLLTERCPAVKCIHVFYAGPMALAFHLGQQIAGDVHPPVIVWNFYRKYDWGIDLTSALLGKPCIVRPQDLTEDGDWKFRDT